MFVREELTFRGGVSVPGVPDPYPKTLKHTSTVSSREVHRPRRPLSRTRSVINQGVSPEPLLWAGYLVTRISDIEMLLRRFCETRTNLYPR